MDVSNCMRTKLVLAKPDCNYKSLLCKIAAPTPRQIYVVDEDNKLLGIVSALDVLKEIMPSYLSADLARSITDGTDFLQKQVEKVKNKLAKDIMITKFVFLHPQNQLLQADALIVEKGCNTLPVLDEQGKLLGEITRRDILLHLVDSCLKFNHDNIEMVDLAKH
ncbi:MAG: CBS domain-containing protein [Desulfoplanes sp.]|nr:CBS domain-containing protein [Desulfoplanes sp.]MDD4649387.1 CBS domain-containing protein [Desulfoplanes sp.]